MNERQVPERSFTWRSGLAGSFGILGGGKKEEGKAEGAKRKLPSLRTADRPTFFCLVWSGPRIETGSVP